MKNNRILLFFVGLFCVQDTQAMHSFLPEPKSCATNRDIWNRFQTELDTAISKNDVEKVQELASKIADNVETHRDFFIASCKLKNFTLFREKRFLAENKLIEIIPDFIKKQKNPLQVIASIHKDVVSGYFSQTRKHLKSALAREFRIHLINGIDFLPKTENSVSFLVSQLSSLPISEKIEIEAKIADFFIQIIASDGLNFTKEARIEILENIRKSLGFFTKNYQEKIKQFLIQSGNAHHIVQLGVPAPFNSEETSLQNFSEGVGINETPQLFDAGSLQEQEKVKEAALSLGHRGVPARSSQSQMSGDAPHQIFLPKISGQGTKTLKEKIGILDQLEEERDESELQPSCFPEPDRGVVSPSESALLPHPAKVDQAMNLPPQQEEFKKQSKISQARQTTFDDANEEGECFYDCVDSIEKIKKQKSKTKNVF